MVCSRMCPWLALGICFVAAGCMDRKKSVPAYQYGTSATADDGFEVHLVRPYSEETHFKGLDRDGDGVLSLAEFLAERQGAGGDPQGDRRVCPSRPGPRRQADLGGVHQPPARTQFRELDDDGDGYLNFKEFWRGTMISDLPRSRWNGPSEHSTRIMTTG